MIHPQKPGKVRVVFDCASKFHGTSLNDQLLQGQDLTNSLVGVLLRFRQEPIATIADVEQMFHQVRVKPEDCDALRFLWWPDGDLSKDPVEHQMLAHLFRATSSPSCASFALKKTVSDNKNDFDVQTIDTVNRNFYVDDCLKSVPVVDEAIKLVDQLPRLLARAGFHLKKWVCNRREVLDKIPSQERAPSVLDLDFGDQQKDRALGIEWNILNDSLGFRIAGRPTSDTRRGIPSLVSAMYDPLGLAKRVLQSLCKQEFGWDEKIPDEQLTRWREWVKDLPNIKGVTLPRSVKPEGFGELHSSQIHHFSEASEEGYGTVSYLRLVDVTGNICCSILFGKSRVAPLKPVTIPWMEPTAATLAAKLDKLLRRELSIPIHETVFWTDSTLVLQYIRNESRRFQTFVTSRLAMIHDASKPSHGTT